MRSRSTILLLLTVASIEAIGVPVPQPWMSVRNRDGVLLRLRGGHKEGCACGEAGDTSDTFLYDAVDQSQLCSFNTERDRGIGAAFRPFCEMDDPTRWLESSDDDQVLMCFSFKTLVTLKSIHIKSSGASAPKRLKLFANRAVDDFDHAEQAPADDEWEHDANIGDSQEHRIPKSGKFTQIKQLTVFCACSHGDDVTRIAWLGFKGENSNVMSKGVVESDYELRPTGGLYTDGLYAGPGHAQGF